MNLLFASDFHIKEKELEEINLILDELLILKDKYNVHKLYLAGDTFDKVNPSPKEIDCFANFVRKINIPIILIAANSHESISKEESILNHFGILKDTITVVKDYSDKLHLFVGHFTLKESKINYGSIIPKSQFKGYKYVVLGHQHTHEIIKPNICHLGAIRYIDFAESKDPEKIWLLVENYKEKGEKCHFLAINSCYPMLDMYFTKKVPQASSQQPNNPYFYTQRDKLQAKLDTLDPKTKVRVIFGDFEAYKKFLPIYSKYKEKFILFKDKKDFEMILTTSDKETKDIPMKESLVVYLKANKVDKDIQKILLEEIK